MNYFGYFIQVKDYFSSKISLVKLTIITVSLNNLSNLHKTLYNTLAIVDAPLKLEHLIIDGDSNDGTKTYLSQLKHPLIKWISEPDNGIYDAMNKGLKMAKGQYVIFMNAGDTFSSLQVLLDIIRFLDHQSPDILFSETFLVNEKEEILGIRSNMTSKKLPNNLNKSTLRKGMMVCHQSVIVRRELAPEYISKNLSADYDWIIKIVSRTQNIIQYPKPIAHYLMGGISKQHHWKSLKDRFLIMAQHYGVLGAIYNHVLVLIQLPIFFLQSRNSNNYL